MFLLDWVYGVLASLGTWFGKRGVGCGGGGWTVQLRGMSIDGRRGVAPDGDDDHYCLHVAHMM